MSDAPILGAVPFTVRSGLVSITFRKLDAEQIVQLVKQAGLDSIEWGGDVHVPHGDIARAEAVRSITGDAGLIVSAYGSYYRCAAPEDKTPTWYAVQDSALALGAPAIRVWAGTKASAAATEDDRQRVADDLQRICVAAAVHSLTIDLEYHGGTLTDTPESTLALLDAVSEPNLRTYWQPRHGVETPDSVLELRRLAPRLGNLHVFHWWPTPAERHPLAAGAERWQAFLAALPKDGRERFASLEFVTGDDSAQFLQDAAVLRQLLSHA